MAVLVEGVSVIVKRASIDQRYPGGWNAFVKDAPNSTLCADSHIARLGFMSDRAALAYVLTLQEHGFLSPGGPEPSDIAICCQNRGLRDECSWAVFGTVEITDAGKKVKVVIAQFIGGENDPLITPDGWTFQGSLSASDNFSSQMHSDKRFRFLRTENGLDVYFDTARNKEVYTAHISRDAN